MTTLSVDKQCIALGCCIKSRKRGFCDSHYGKHRRGTNVLLKDGHVLPIMKRKVCAIDDCTRIALAHGRCEYHNNKLRRTGAIISPSGVIFATRDNAVCKIQSCSNAVSASGLCIKHYRHKRLHGDPLGGAFRTGTSKVWGEDNHGYVVKYDPTSLHALSNGKVSQHRQVMGDHIGRPLRRDENVHHKNGDRTDNRIDNLELWSKSQPAGQRVVDKLVWAKEIVALYGHLDIL